ncbi:uncharacterized protein LOC143084133 [Mytilus galloprovincialis]|uniref:uncharacterized protein LOC143084133 n=1 Tax=Mytilus galloprovincialis TaxID=29158 RepID=UPI003F7C0755
MNLHTFSEDKSYLQTLEKDKTFPVEYEYDSEEAEVYEDTFIEGGVNRGQNATAAVSKPVGVKELKITSIKKKTCTSDALQQKAQKLLTERLLSKPRRTSPRKRPATMTYNPFDAEHLDSYIAKSAAKRKQNIINDDSSEMQPPDVKPSTINQSGKQNEENVTRKELKD